mmetsp:Transcript_26533/g.62108  ORF Transcript_26533/g.62108 Transcript_26533/m.62108 type:complete len:221 (-) Transcript_26533:988-1650(-)
MLYCATDGSAGRECCSPQPSWLDPRSEGVYHHRPAFRPARLPGFLRAGHDVQLETGASQETADQKSLLYQRDRQAQRTAATLGEPVDNAAASRIHGQPTAGSHASRSHHASQPASTFAFAGAAAWDGGNAAALAAASISGPRGELGSSCSSGDVRPFATSSAPEVSAAAEECEHGHTRWHAATIELAFGRASANALSSASGRFHGWHFPAADAPVGPWHR